MGDMDDIVREFLVESNENLDQLDRDLVTLEKDPDGPRGSRQHLSDDSHHQGHKRFPGLLPAGVRGARRRKPPEQLARRSPLA